MCLSCLEQLFGFFDGILFGANDIEVASVCILRDGIASLGIVLKLGYLLFGEQVDARVGVEDHEEEIHGFRVDVGRHKQVVKGLGDVVFLEGFLTEAEETLRLILKLFFTHAPFFALAGRLGDCATSRIGAIAARGVFGGSVEVGIHAVDKDFKGFVSVVTKLLGHDFDVFFLVFVDFPVNHHHQGEVLEVSDLQVVVLRHFKDDIALGKAFLADAQALVEFFLAQSEILGNRKKKVFLVFSQCAVAHCDGQQVDNMRQLGFFVRIVHLHRKLFWYFLQR